MNEIEKMFYRSVLEYYSVKTVRSKTEVQLDNAGLMMECQKDIGIYIVDFLFTRCMPMVDEIQLVVEIDGHEAHKTKEQRFTDYRRERFLQQNGYFIMRFMGSEVFVNPVKCVEEVDEYLYELDKLYWDIARFGYYAANTDSMRNWEVWDNVKNQEHKTGFFLE